MENKEQQNQVNVKLRNQIKEFLEMETNKNKFDINDGSQIRRDS